MNILADKLPQSVTVHGVKYTVRWSHQECLRAFDAMVEEDDIATALAIFYADAIPEDTDAAFYAMCDFLSGAPVPQYQKGKGQSGTKERPYSYRYDQIWILGAFWSNYQIDLTSRTLHWWVFHALMENLRDCPMADIIHFRMAEEKGSREEVKKIRQRKAEWRLPDVYQNTKREDAITEALLNGGAGLEELLRN